MQARATASGGHDAIKTQVTCERTSCQEGLEVRCCVLP